MAGFAPPSSGEPVPSVEELTEQMVRAMEAKEAEDAAAAAAAAGQQVGTEGSSSATKPLLPPTHRLASNMTVDEVLADLNKSPLFMTELEENDDIAALQALNYEGTALENASDFRTRGNESFRGRHYRDAREFYTKGVQILAEQEARRARGEATTSPEGVEDSEEEVAEQRKVLEGLYANRAACSLELLNYRSCWLDCAAALRLNPANVKAYYRSSRALLAVGRIEEADDACARGLALDADNKPLRAVADEIVKRARARDEKRRKDAERDATQRRRATLLRAALKARGIPSRRSDKPPDMEDAAVALVPDPDDPRSRLSFPTLLLYPVHYESDFIKAFEETHTLDDHLGYILPLPWDDKGVYRPDNVEAYVETRDGGLLKMGRRVSLLKVLSTGKVEVVDDVVRIFVLPKGDAAQGWIKKFKEQKAAMIKK
ncbi:TPR repeat protein [Geosmithia morbida]|uniref:TPR repeat protein n=1 Tax=Geosmithia morbida TaxID=1094350 RepID=A0A9P4Z510_9HYPO|nr:TPR repeat protein [Geosmithia morbida]KAF4126794.1 TPR repeat protein [Geosmithia morbida]